MMATLALPITAGGIQSIQIVLFEYFSKNGFPCKLFDSIDGYVYKELTRNNIEFTFIEIDQRQSKKDYSQYLHEDDLLILFNLSFFESMLLFKHSKSKILLWEVYYPWLENFPYTKYYILKLLAKKQEKKILSILHKHRAMYFIDFEGKSIVENLLNVNISNKKYLNIPVKIAIKANIMQINKKLIITYVGRAIDWKIYPLIKVLEDVKNNNLHDTIMMNIVTDNIVYFKEKIKKHIQNIDLFEINYFENLFPKELEDLLRHSNLNIGMGTAALEGAKLGIPTILIDASLTKLPKDYKYRWIFNAIDFKLGDFVNDDSINYGGEMSIIEVFTDLKLNYGAISNKCFDYISSNFNIETIANQILDYSKEMTLTLTPIVNLPIIKIHRFLRYLSIK